MYLDPLAFQLCRWYLRKSGNHSVQSEFNFLGSLVRSLSKTLHDLALQLSSDTAHTPESSFKAKAPWPLSPQRHNQRTVHTLTTLSISGFLATMTTVQDSFEMAIASSEVNIQCATEVSCSGYQLRHQPPQIIWQLLAPRLRQKARVMPNIHDPRMYSESPWGAFDKLAKLSDPKNREDFFFAKDSLNKSSSVLEKLPTELLDSIIEKLNSFEAVVHLGLCSKSMWNRALGYVLDERRRRAGCWAKTPILCAAETVDDFPDALIDIDRTTDEGPRTWFQRVTNDFQELRRAEKLHECFEFLCEALREGNLEGDCELPGQNWHWRCPSILKSKVEAVLQELREPRACKSWVLRNLTEKTFVRLQLVRDTEKYGYESRTFVVHVDGDDPGMSLDQLLLKKICWSGRHEDGNGPKGEWAGHCFDVVESGSWSFGRDHWLDVTDGSQVTKVTTNPEEGDAH